LSNPDKFSGALLTGSVFYHLGWKDNERQYRDSCYKQLRNIQYTLDAVHLANSMGCKRFVGLGGQDEYGHVSCPMNSMTPVNPVTPTGTAKYAAGRFSKLECEKLNLEYIWVRLLSVYGINDHEDRLVKIFIGNCKNNKPMDLGPCTHIWDYLYEDDAGRALFMIGEKGVAGKLYTLGSGIGKPLKEYLEIIRKQVNPEYVPCYGKTPYTEKSVKYLCADISELTKDTGWRPEVSFEVGIKNILGNRI
jgi:nucleoside-diphosphate-sugar epimerase